MSDTLAILLFQIGCHNLLQILDEYLANHDQFLRDTGIKALPVLTPPLHSHQAVDIVKKLGITPVKLQLFMDVGHLSPGRHASIENIPQIIMTGNLSGCGQVTSLMLLLCRCGIGGDFGRTSMPYSQLMISVNVAATL